MKSWARADAAETHDQSALRGVLPERDMLTNAANEALRNLGLVKGHASDGQINAIVAAADDGGTIQAENMVYLFPGRPEWHNPTKILKALYWAGCKDA